MIPTRLPLAAALVLACSTPVSRPTVKVPPLAGTPLDVTAQDETGRDVRVEVGDGRVMVVDFFASWCQPCKVQLPHLDRLGRELHDQGLAVVGISFDDDPAAARGFAASMQVGFPVLWDRGGDRLAGALSIERLPTTLVVDRRGIIRQVQVGYSATEGEKLEAEVKKLLGER